MKLIGFITFLTILSTTALTLERRIKMKKKVLIVVTSHDKLGSTGKQTGYYLPEVTHPFFKFVKAGFKVDIASIKGGKAPMDSSSRNLEDNENRKFLESAKYSELLENTKSLRDIDPKDYKAILFAGGHVTMWDFKGNSDVNRVSTAIYEDGGIAPALCHGPAALVDIKLSNGSYLVSGKKLTGFSNAEEEAAGLTKVMPFLLESSLIERGAIYEKAGLWQEKIVMIFSYYVGN